MSKNTIKNIIMVVAIILCFALAGGWIAQTVVRNKKENEVNDAAVFTVTPQNTASKMKLMAQTYSGDDVISTHAETYTITAETKYYSGAVNWTLSWTGSEVYWNSSEKTTNVNNCIKLTTIDERTVRVECLQPFGQQIAITAALADKPSVTEKCVCDYKQTYEFDEIEIGFNTFLKDGSLGLGLISAEMGIVPASVELHSSETLEYAIKTISSSYTKEGSEVCKFPEISFSLTPNTEVIEAYGLDKYSFASYTGNFENALSGTLEGFFDNAWGEHAISETSFTMNDFAVDLCNAVNEQGFGIDSEDLYILTLNGLPEASGSVGYGYRVDLYNLMQLVGDMATLSLNKSNITFGG